MKGAGGITYKAGRLNECNINIEILFHKYIKQKQGCLVSSQYNQSISATFDNSMGLLCDSL